MKKYISFLFFVGLMFLYAGVNAQWVQQCPPILGSDAIGTHYEGSITTLSADGKTAISSFRQSIEGSGFFVFRWIGSQWVQQSRIVVGSSDWYPQGRSAGIATSSDGNTIAITGLTNDSVRIYVFENNGWRIQAQFQPKTRSATSTRQNTGLSYDGNTLVYKAKVWIRSGNNWSFQASLTPFDRPVFNGYTCDSSNHFSCLAGSAISADGNTIVIGDFYGLDSTTNAWVFVRNGTSWAQQGTRLEGIRNTGYSNTALVHPASVSISGNGNTLAIGSPDGFNAFWIFHRSGSIWTEEDNGPLKCVDINNIFYGSGGPNSTLSYDGNHLIVGGFYYWEKVGSTWLQIGGPYTVSKNSVFDSIQSAYDVSDALTLDSSGTRLFLGGGSFNTGVGGAWYFVLSGNTWNQYGNLLRGVGNSGGIQQGDCVAISRDGKVLAESAIYENGSAGGVWVFTRSGADWNQTGQRIYVADTTWQSRKFGTSVSLSANGSTLAIGSPNSNFTVNYENYGQGNVYIYTRSGGNYVPQVDSITFGQFMGFGTSVCLSDDGNTLLVSTADSGAFVYVRNGVVWTQQAFLNTGTSFGGVIALSGDGNTAAVGDQSMLNFKGGLYIYKRNGTNWVLQANNILPSGLLQYEYFPASLSLSQNGNFIAAGCQYHQSNFGNIFVASRSGSIWSSLDSVIGFATPNIYFNGKGVSISSTGDTIVDLGHQNQWGLAGICMLVRNGGQWVLSSSIADYDPMSIYYSHSSISVSGDMKLIADGYSAVRVWRSSTIHDSLLLKKDATCAQVGNGKLRVGLVGGTPPYKYAWSNGAVNIDSIVNLAPGIYRVTLTDAGGDTLVRQFTIYSLTNPRNGNFSTSYSCGTGLGAIRVTSTGGTTPYSYVWNTLPVQNADSAVGLNPDTYTYSVTDAAGCTYSDSARLPAVSYWSTITSVLPDCSNNGSATITMYGGMTPYTYNWSTGDNNSTTDSLSAAIYSATVTDASGCSVSGTANLMATCNSSIKGRVFFDRNNNCLQDGQEKAAIGFTMIATDGISTVYGSTNDSGDYTILVPNPGTYTVSIGHWQECFYMDCAGGMYPMQATVPVAGATAGNIIFPLLDSGIDLTLELENQDPFPGSSIDYKIYYGNLKDSIIPNGTVTLVFDANLVLNSTTPPYTSYNNATHTITWNVTNVGFLSPYSQLVKANFTVPASVVPQTWLSMQATITPTLNDCNIVNNSLTLPFMVSGSLDPNYKAAYPENILDFGDSVITYTIHFQNTGIDSTHFIEVLDTLSPNLDPSSVRTVGACHHPYSFTVRENGILDWLFSPFALPDSATDPQNSQGYISYQVRIKSGLPIGAEIKNTASIYFDYNTAVVTNTTSNVISLSTNVTSISIPDFRLYPNPANSVVTISVDESLIGSTLTIYDVTGKKVAIVPLSSIINQVSIGLLASGVYVAEVKTKEVSARRRWVKM